MSKLLSLPAKFQAEVDALEQVTELAESLSEPVPTISAATRRREQAEAVTDLAENEHFSAIKLCPVLVEALEAEITRLETTTAAVDEMLFRETSIDIQRCFTEAISSIIDSILIRGYANSTHSFDSLLTTLARTVITSDSDTVTIQALGGLCGATQYRPEAVAEAIARTADIEYVLNLLTDIINIRSSADASKLSNGVNESDSVTWWARLYAVLATRFPDPDSIPSTHQFRTVPLTLDDTETTTASIFADIVRAVVPTLGPTDGMGEPTSAVPVDPAVYNSCTEQIQMSGPSTDAMVALGEAITACPHVFPAVPESVISHTRNLETRQSAASAVGCLFIDGPATPEEQIQCAIAWSKNADAEIGRSRIVREIAGEVAAAHRTALPAPEPVQPLVEKVCDSSGGPRRNAALALSEAVIRGEGVETAVDPTPSLCERIDGSGKSEAAAKALGEAVITMDPSTCAVDPPSCAREHVEQHTGRERMYSTRALGLAVAADSPMDLPAHLVERAHTGKAVVRWAAGRTLGELAGILSFEYETKSWPDALLDRMHDDETILRFDIAGTVGEAIAALEIDNQNGGVEKLIRQVLKRGGPSRSWSAEVLGELVIAGAVPEYTSELFEPMIESATRASSPARRELAQRLGEATAITSSSPAAITHLQSLTRQIQLPDRDGQTAAAHALGEAVALIEAPDPDGDLIQRATAALQNREGLHRWRLAQALGKLEATVDMPTTADEPLQALADRALGDDGTDWSAAAAIGTFVATNDVQPTSLEPVPESLVDAFDSQSRTAQTAAAQALGLVSLGDPSTFVTAAAETVLEDKDSPPQAKLLPKIAASEIFAPEEFMTILAEATDSDQRNDLLPYLTADGDGYEYIVGAVQEVTARAERTEFPLLRTQFEDALSGSIVEVNSAETRLSMVDILANLDSKMGKTDSQSNTP